MSIVSVYKCLCDETRLRILNLLLEGPLCVCHLSQILKLDQPKISRHLKALKAAGAVETERCYNWTICRVAVHPSAVLDANLKCLQDLRVEDPQFGKDLKKRKKALKEIQASECCDLPEAIRSLAQTD